MAFSDARSTAQFLATSDAASGGGVTGAKNMPRQVMPGPRAGQAEGQPPSGDVPTERISRHVVKIIVGGFSWSHSGLSLGSAFGAQPLTPDLSRDLQIIGKSLILPVVIFVVAALASPRLVQNAWPLVAILCLGIFAGSVGTMASTKKHPR
jgi:hypothetical protein